MIRKILFVLFVLSGFFYACEDDDSGFNVMMPDDGNSLRFEPRAGGAMMYYKLPDVSEVFNIRVRYINSQGEKVLKKGGYGGDSLLLDGFVEGRKSVPAQITLMNRYNDESDPIDVTFDTEDSAPFAFIKKAKVTPSWGGFQVAYDAPDIVTGMAHILYIGINPKTQKEDTILFKSFPITRGGDTITCTLSQVRDKYTVILRTEDFKGYRVGQKIFQDVESYSSVKFPIDETNIDASYMPVIDRDYAKVGVKYLVDGDLKGEQRMKAVGANAWTTSGIIYGFLAGPHALNKPLIIDLKEEKIPAFIRIYSMQSMTIQLPASTTSDQEALGYVWRARYGDKLPCEATVYAGNDPDPDATTWVKMGVFKQNPQLEQKEQWCYPANVFRNQQGIETLKDLQAADSIFMDVPFRASEVKYRYLKLVINDTFYEEVFGFMGAEDTNPSNYVTMQELEVYVKKD